MKPEEDDRALVEGFRRVWVALPLLVIIAVIVYGIQAGGLLR